MQRETLGFRKEVTWSDLRFKKSDLGDYPGGPVFKTVFSRAGVQGLGGVPSLAGELRSRMLCGMAKE